MKKLLSIVLVCCTAFVYANDDSFFEETDENITTCSIPFAAEEPTFIEEDDEGDRVHQKSPHACEHCDPKEEEARSFSRNAWNPTQGSYVSWSRYKANFGMEKVFIRFPQKPAISQSSTLLTAYAYDNAVLYSLAGYFPPLGNIDPANWFDAVLRTAGHYPFVLVNHVVLQTANGDWVMDYVSHDQVQNLIIKARAVITHFNGYILQCVKPNGMRDYFDYFLDNVHVRRGE